MNVKSEREITAGMHKWEIQHIHLAIHCSCTQYLLLSLFFVSQQVLLSVCVCHAREPVCMFTFIFEHPQGVPVDVRFHLHVMSHMCARGARACICWHSFSPLRVRKEVVFGGDKYTGCTLSAATQTQAGCMPAVKRGLYLCMCVTLCVWIKGGEAGEGYEHVWRFCLQGEG